MWQTPPSGSVEPDTVTNKRKGGLPNQEELMITPVRSSGEARDNGVRAPDLYRVL